MHNLLHINLAQSLQFYSPHLILIVRRTASILNISIQHILTSLLSHNIKPFMIKRLIQSNTKLGIYLQ